MSNFRYTRRAALAALFAVGMHLAAASRARAETPRRGECRRAHGVVVAHRRRAEDAQPLQRELEFAARRAAAAPGARHAALAGDDARAAAKARRQRYSRWKELSPEQKELARKRWHKYRELPPEQQARVRENYHRFKKLTPEQRQRLRERWQNATPEERQRMLERRRQRLQRRQQPPPR